MIALIHPVFIPLVEQNKPFSPVVGGKNINLHHANDITLVNWIDVPFANSIFSFSIIPSLLLCRCVRNRNTHFEYFGSNECVWLATGYRLSITKWICVTSNPGKLWTIGGSLHGRKCDLVTKRNYSMNLIFQINLNSNIHQQSATKKLNRKYESDERVYLFHKCMWTANNPKTK